MFAILFTVVLNSTTSFMWIRCCSKYEVTSSNTSIASLKLFNFTEEEGCLCHHHLLIRLIKKARFPIITHSNTHCKVIIITTQIFIHQTAIIYIYSDVLQVVLHRSGCFAVFARSLCISTVQFLMQCFCYKYNTNYCKISNTIVKFNMIQGIATEQKGKTYM